MAIFECRDVFTPFSLSLQNTKAALPAEGAKVAIPTQSGAAAGEETRLIVPFVNLTLESKEFAILLDVINNVGLAEVNTLSLSCIATSSDEAGVLRAASVELAQLVRLCLSSLMMVSVLCSHRRCGRSITPCSFSKKPRARNWTQCRRPMRH